MIEPTRKPLLVVLLILALIARCLAQGMSGRTHAKQAPISSGVTTGAAHPAVKDAKHRPITAGGFVDDAPVIFNDITRQS
ncbi:MAG TPA: hypothetical protein VG498_06295 [Terriglobales bacterium]|nr:hypothetical protein [Terriglobales bacterium]